MNLMSSTLLLEDTQVPFDQLQAEQISLFREAWTAAGHPESRAFRQPQRHADHLRPRSPAVRFRREQDQVGWLDGAISRFGRSYTGEPDRIAEELSQDAAVLAADTVLLTVPSQLGVDYNAAMLETIARESHRPSAGARRPVTSEWATPFDRPLRCNTRAPPRRNRRVKIPVVGAAGEI